MDTRLARSVFGEYSFYRETRGMRLGGYHVAKRSSDLRVCVFGLNVAFNNFSVISRRCLIATGSSMLTFIVLPH